MRSSARAVPSMGSVAKRCVYYWVSESELGVRIPSDEGQGVAYYIMAMDD